MIGTDRLIVKIVLSLSLILLAGCARQAASTLPHNASLSWQTRRTQLLRVNRWDIQGAIAIKTPQKAFSASVNWEQVGRNRYTINLFGPLGMGAVKLIGKPNAVTLINDKNQRIQAQNPEALLRQQLGWTLPVSTFYYWVRGVPTPGLSKAVTYDQYHHIKSLKQLGWRIQYLDYTAVGRYDLPSKILMQNAKLHAKLIISRWQLG
mgnify:CR=1 FL=1|jgi:outer membrane lipoprotein LolB